jgi:hypothetical protein
MAAKANRSRLSRLPAKLRAELDRRLLEGNFSNHAALARWLADQGYAIGEQAVSRYGSRLERNLDAVRVATAQARAVVAAAGDDDLKMNEALLRLVQQHLFNVLVALDPADPRGANLAAIARSVAEMGRASIVQRKLVEETRARMAAKIGAAEREIDAAAGRDGGLSPQAVDRIRKVLTEIAE